MTHERLEKPADKFQVGQSVRVKILRTEPEERKIGLSIKAAQDELGEKELTQYQSERRQEERASSVTLGDMSGDLRALQERVRQAREEKSGDEPEDR
jgi:ribosomal protein S1